MAGSGQLASFQAIPHVRGGATLRLLENYTPNPWQLYVYRPQRGPTPARMRMVFDALVAFLEDPACIPVEP